MLGISNSQSDVQIHIVAIDSSFRTNYTELANDECSTLKFAEQKKNSTPFEDLKTDSELKDH